MMTYLKQPISAAMALLMMSLMAFTVQADTVDDEVSSLQKQWANVNYQITGKAQKKAFKKLIEQGHRAVETYPKSASLWAWRGIIQSSYGAVKGGLGALSLVKAAKKDFEQALALDEQALNGSTYASLALLYHKVPGWPIGFGDDDKAQQLFKKALAINPQSRESNYFYAEFLYDEGQYQQAKKHLTTAQNVLFWGHRPVAYQHRQQQIIALMEKVDNQLVNTVARRKE